MITEDYVSFETAKLLKEKGFNERCLKQYYINGNLSDISIEARYNTIDGQISAPTHQQTKRWLLKKHNIFISILFFEDLGEFGYTIEDIVKKKCIATSENTSYKEPEEADDAAIKHYLENLI